MYERTYSLSKLLCKCKDNIGLLKLSTIEQRPTLKFFLIWKWGKWFVKRKPNENPKISAFNCGAMCLGSGMERIDGKEKGGASDRWSAGRGEIGTVLGSMGGHSWPGGSHDPAGRSALCSFKLILDTFAKALLQKSNLNTSPVSLNITGVGRRTQQRGDQVWWSSQPPLGGYAQPSNSFH